MTRVAPATGLPPGAFIALRPDGTPDVLAFHGVPEPESSKRLFEAWREFRSTLEGSSVEQAAGALAYRLARISALDAARAVDEIGGDHAEHVSAIGCALCSARLSGYSARSLLASIVLRLPEAGAARVEPLIAIVSPHLAELDRVAGLPVEHNGAPIASREVSPAELAALRDAELEAVAERAEVRGDHVYAKRLRAFALGLPAVLAPEAPAPSFGEVAAESIKAYGSMQSAAAGVARAGDENAPEPGTWNEIQIGNLGPIVSMGNAYRDGYMLRGGDEIDFLSAGAPPAVLNLGTRIDRGNGLEWIRCSLGWFEAPAGAPVEPGNDDEIRVLTLDECIEAEKISPSLIRLPSTR